MGALVKRPLKSVSFGEGPLCCCAVCLPLWRAAGVRGEAWRSAVYNAGAVLPGIQSVLRNSAEDDITAPTEGDSPPRDHKRQNCGTHHATLHTDEPRCEVILRRRVLHISRQQGATAADSSAYANRGDN